MKASITRTGTPSTIAAAVQHLLTRGASVNVTVLPLNTYRLEVDAKDAGLLPYGKVTYSGRPDMTCRPYPGLHVTLLTRQSAERHDRRVYNVPADHGLGWKPYTVRVQSHGCTAYTAFHSVRALRTWLGNGFTVRIASRGLGVAYGRIVATT